MRIRHFDQVDCARIEAEFHAGRRHRATLRIPFHGRPGTKTLCVIGQNPSMADELQADKTVQFLERYVFREQPAYAQILILNLYSRVDPDKSDTRGLDHPACRRAFKAAIAGHHDFLVVYGKLRRQGAYRFPERACALKSLLAGKNVYKFDIGTDFAPHPRNRLICYRDAGLTLVRYDFGDVANGA